MVPDTNAEAIHVAMQSSETQRRMMRVAAPQVIVLNGQLLNITGKGTEQAPEAPGCYGLHFAGGQSRTSPCSDSSSASRNRKSSLPATESRSICSSQRVCSRSRIQ